MGCDGGQGSAKQVTFLRPPHIPRMAATSESLFPSGGDLDSRQLQMEPDEVDTLKEGEDSGTQGGRPQGEEEEGAETSWSPHSSTFSPVS